MKNIFKKENIRNKHVVASLFVVGLILLVVGISYAMYTFTGTGTKENVITTGQITVEFAEQNNILIQNRYPETDAEGLASTDLNSQMTFTVSSNIAGTATVNYAVGLTEIEEGATLTQDYIKINLTKNGSAATGFTTTTGNTIGSFRNETFNDLLTSHVIARGSVTGTQTDTYTLKAWIDENYNLPTTDTSSGKVHSSTTTSEEFSFKIKVVGTDGIDDGTYTLKLTAGKGIMGIGAMVESTQNLKQVMVEDGDIIYSTDGENFSIIEEGTYTTLPEGFGDEMEIKAGDTVMVMALPAEGYVWRGFTGTFNAVGNLSYDTYIYEFTMPAYDVTLVANDLKTVYDDEFPLEFNTIEIANSNNYAVSLEIALYKISNLTPDNEAMMDSTIILENNGETNEYSVIDDNESEIGHIYLYGPEYNNEQAGILVVSSKTEISPGNGLTYTYEPGVYAASFDDWSSYSANYTLKADYTAPETEDADDKKANAYALILDNSGDADNAVPMIFVREDEAISVGDTYESETYGSLEVTAVYTDFENKNYYCKDWINIFPPEWVDGNQSNITSVIFEDKISPISTAAWFGGFSSLISIDLEKLDTSNVTDMSFMFNNCFKLTSLNLNFFNTEKVTNMNSMFYDCENLKSVLFSQNWDTSNVTDMTAMFNGCGVLTLDCSSWNVNKVTSYDIFNNNATGVTAPTWVN